MFSLLQRGALFVLCSLCIGNSLNAQTHQAVWTDISPAAFPPSVRVFESNTSFPDGSEFHATYAVFDLQDKSIGLKNTNSGATFRTPLEHATTESDSVYVSVNAGFFSATAPVSLIIDDYIKRANAVFSLSRPGPSGNVTFFPARAAFSLNASRTPEIFWAYNIDSAGNPSFRYDVPGSNHETNLVADTRPSSLYPAGARPLVSPMVVSGGPVILKDSLLFLTHQEEVLESSVLANTKQPRTAIGYTSSGKIIIMVVDGRQPGFATGINLADLAQLFRSLGATHAINLDGGGSSAMVSNYQLITSPSDPGNNMRAIPSALMIMKRPIVFDTEDSLRFAQVGSWSETANAGQYGPTRSRVAATNITGSNKAWYTFKNLEPAQYRAMAWFNVSGAPNRGSSIPYVLQRNGLPNADTVRLNQTLTANANRFNNIGTFHIGPNDSLMITSMGPGNFASIDAIGLVKVGESLPQTVFAGGDSINVLVNDTIRTSIFFQSQNTGVKLDSLRIFKISNGQETALGGPLSLQAGYVDTLSWVYPVQDPAGIIKFRFEIKDALGRRTNAFYTVKVNPFALRLHPSAASGRHQRMQSLDLQVIAETGNAMVTLDSSQVWLAINNQPLQRLAGNLLLSGNLDTLNYSYLITENPTDRLRFNFKVFGSNGLSEINYLAIVDPQRGNLRLAVVADFNSSFGSTSYEWQVDSLIQRLPRLWQPDLVVSGGDMIAGQSATLTPQQVDAMWAAFDQKIAQPLRQAQIPFVFTLGNHDGALQLDRDASVRYWSDSSHWPGGFPVDTTNFPFYHAFLNQPNGDYFFVSWDNAAANINASVVNWMDSIFATPLAQAASYRFLIGHMPLYGVSPERASPGNVVANADAIRQILENRRVHTYISGHQHAYYPGKRGEVELLNTGAIGSGARAWIGIDKHPVNTVTIMDVFTSPDTIIYTTYDIKHQLAENMTLFNEKELPEAIFSFNGFTVRRDVPISGTSAGRASAINLVTPRSERGTATIGLQEQGQNIFLQGNFQNLVGRLLDAPDAISIHQALHSENGPTRFTISQINSNDGRNGTFETMLSLSQEQKEILSAGAYYMVFKTDSFPNGELRSQLYRTGNVAPSAPVILSPTSQQSVEVRDILAILPVVWSRASDAESNPVTYFYELANDSAFSQILIAAPMGKAIEFKAFTESRWFDLIQQAPIGQEVVLYHRVTATDGKNQSNSGIQTLRLKRSNAPVVGSVEIPAPDFLFDENFEKQAPSANGHGVTVDAAGKIWSVAFGGRVKVYNPDGSVHVFGSTAVLYNSSQEITGWTYNGATLTAASLRGAGTDNDGHVLLSNANSNLVKVNYLTGEVIGSRNSGTSLSNLTVDQQGRIFAASVTGNQHFLWQQNVNNPQQFDTIRSAFNIGLRPAVIRAAAISREGTTIYLPNEAGQNIFIYSAANGINFELDTVLPSGSNAKCNSIFAGSDSSLWYVTNSSILRAILHFKDFKNNLSYKFELKDVLSNDLRGLAFSPTKDTFYVIGSDNGRISRYFVMPQSGQPGVSPFIGNYTIATARTVNSLGVADSLNRYAQLTGVVQTTNFNRTGSGYFMADQTAGILLLNAAKQINLQPGDSIAVFGYLRQTEGNLYLELDSTRFLGNGSNLTLAVSLSQLPNEAQEGSFVQIDSLRFNAPSSWTNSGYQGFGITFSTPSDSIKGFVPAASALYQLYAPGSLLRVKGRIIQKAGNASLLNGYQLLLLDTSDIQLIPEVHLQAVADTVCNNNSLVFEANIDNAGNRANMLWLRNGQAIAGANQTQLTTLAPVGNGSIGFTLLPADSIYRVITDTVNALTLPYLVHAQPVMSLGANLSITENDLVVLRPGAGFVAYDWSNGATSDTLLIRGADYLSGSYSFSLTVTDSNGCMAADTVVILVRNATSVRDVHAHALEMKLLPNPVLEDALLLAPLQGSFDITIYSMNGAAILKTNSYFEQSQAPLKLSDLAPGMYFVELITGEEIYYVKFMKTSQ